MGLAKVAGFAPEELGISLENADVGPLTNTLILEPIAPTNVPALSEEPLEDPEGDVPVG